MLACAGLRCAAKERAQLDCTLVRFVPECPYLLQGVGRLRVFFPVQGVWHVGGSAWGI